MPIKIDTDCFGQKLLDYCKYENLIILDQKQAKADTFTFLSYALGSVAWPDHVVSTISLHSIIDKLWVDYS